MRKLNNIWIGTVAGIVLPFISLLIYHAFKFADISFGEFLASYQKIGVLTHVISLAVIPNLLLFFAFIQMNYLRGARGVLLATFLFAFAVLIMRFV